MNSVLHRVTAEQIEPHPFPHLVIDDAVEPELYRELAATMPPAEMILRGRIAENNTPYRLSAHDMLLGQRTADSGQQENDENDAASRAPVVCCPLSAVRMAAWREFIRLHTSKEFFDDVVRVFGGTIRALHPELESRTGALDALRTSIRYAEPFADAALDCQITWGSPVRESTRCHRVHVDRQLALYAGLLYMRRPEDDSRGGDLELYRFRSRPRVFEPGRYVDDALVERVKTIPYAANRLVFFIHSSDALHGVSARSATPHPRLHVNFLAELQEMFWELAA